MKKEHQELVKKMTDFFLNQSDMSSFELKIAVVGDILHYSCTSTPRSGSEVKAEDKVDVS